MELQALQARFYAAGFVGFVGSVDFELDRGCGDGVVPSSFSSSGRNASLLWLVKYGKTIGLMGKVGIKIYLWYGCFVVVTERCWNEEQQTDPGEVIYLLSMSLFLLNLGPTPSSWRDETSRK